MPISILMPALSPTMTEGNLIKWLKKEGDSVKAGDVLAEIETDKATMEVEAVDEGTLGRIVIPAGTEQVAVNSVIALLLEEGEDAASLNKAAAAPQAKPTEAKAADAPSSKVISITAPEKSTPTSLQKATNAGERVFASPLARRLAEHTNVDLHTISGTGPHGRIVKLDVESATKSPKPAGGTTIAPVYGESGYIDLPLNNIRKVTAKRLTESKQQVPHFYLTTDCTLDALLALRSDLNARLEDEKISVNDFIIRATALALLKVPEANVSWQETFLRQYQSADIAVAVAIKDGLITPIIRAADQKSLRQISGQMKTLAEKARSGKLAPEEFQGGTFTISNLGMYGITHFGAIINPPQACILAVGKGEQRPVIKDGQIQIATLMTCTLSVDHRAVDGATGAGFLAAFKELIEDPLQLLI
ncbi:MAG: pyruvate dehydrogenase complex dihydrolipoamide acetyltransferase [Alphaproteobacteria bacterium]|nr:pyruvate dehydrogenase complex dihydrolipoamide acetyltransferase [Alphaproteobacteria bacterium]